MTSGDHSWALSLSSILKCEFINFADPASHNLSQLHKFQKWMLSNDINGDDIIIWQLGFCKEPKLHLGLEHLEKVKRADNLSRKIFDVDSFYIDKNVLDNKERIGLLYINPLFSQYKKRKDFNDDAEVFQELLFMFLTIKKLGSKLLVLRGKDDYIDETQWANMKLFLNKKNINFLEESLVDWCRSNKLSFMIDDYHPTKEAASEYAREIVYPRLINLGWI